MKRKTLRAIACLLAALLLGTAAACSGPDTPAETTAGTAVGTGAATQSPATEGADATEATTEAATDPLPADFVVTEAEGVATVTTPLGLSYALSGYTSLAGGAASFEDKLTYTLGEEISEEKFNRFTLTYTASAPVRVTLSYTERGKSAEEYYFLDAGEGEFSGLTPGFLKKLNGRNLTTLTVESCTGEAAAFTLTGLTVGEAEVPEAYIYVENERFRLGVDLSWGGTINYLADKTCPIGGLENLVNRHDTGRLIQQSFYGTRGVPGEYEPGVSFDVKWSYNPVQGGDQYNNASRLVDLVITDTSVYIKSQPQDWSLNDQLTPSYMENTYTLTADCVRVDNRFTDYSGWDHPFSGQELPALYTVSYLDRFVWYGGEDSWTGDTLSHKDDLPFWGDYEGKCTFYVREKNTETWCAWVNSSDDYGLGLYVPNVDRLKAGRYEYNGSKSDTDNATSYVAPYNTMKLVSFTPLSYSYLLTTGSTAAIRETFTTHKDFTDNASLHENYQPSRLPSVEGDITKLDFTEGKNLSLLSSLVNTTVSFDETAGAVKLTSGPYGDSNVTIPYGTASTPLSAEDYGTLRIEYCIPAGQSLPAFQCDIFPCAGEIAAPDGGARIRRDLVADGEYHVLEVKLAGLPYWKGDIHMIRFDYFDNSKEGDVMFIRSITLE